jgi:hypothetical protein
MFFWRAGRRLAAVCTWVFALNVTVRLCQIGPWVIGQRSNSGTMTIEQTLATNTGLGVAAGLVASALVAILWGQLARRVDYRWFDGFFVLVPFYQLFWTARIVWRLTYRISPDRVRDWPPADVRQPSWGDLVARKVWPRST